MACIRRGEPPRVWSAPCGITKAFPRAPAWNAILIGGKNGERIMGSSRRRSESPYLDDPSRLADVLAAIQATATYKFYQLGFEGRRDWAWRVTGDSSNSDHIKRVFGEHPEFFRIDSSGKGSLVWRRQNQKLYDVDRGEEISRAEFNRLTEDEKTRISRAPLHSNQIAVLINSAIELHSGALEHQHARRWWVSPSTALAGVVLGGLIGWLA